jgi:hypothetical protein
MVRARADSCGDVSRIAKVELFADQHAPLSLPRHRFSDVLIDCEAEAA